MLDSHGFSSLNLVQGSPFPCIIIRFSASVFLRKEASGIKTSVLSKTCRRTVQKSTPCWTKSARSMGAWITGCLLGTPYRTKSACSTGYESRDAFWAHLIGQNLPVIQGACIMGCLCTLWRIKAVQNLREREGEYTSYKKYGLKDKIFYGYCNCPVIINTKALCTNNVCSVGGCE